MADGWKIVFPNKYNLSSIIKKRRFCWLCFSREDDQSTHCLVENRLVNKLIGDRTILAISPRNSIAYSNGMGRSNTRMGKLENMN